MKICRRYVFIALLVCCSFVAMPLALAKDKAAQKIEIELVFVLDTTGSMGGLIQGAKAKIWSIVNTIATAKPTPDIKVGLVGYRDKTDAYITEVTDLSTDLDAVYTKLMAFQAQGGGDFPEDVNSALAAGVDKISWSKDKKVIKMIYLVGDAPPHMDYKNEETFESVCPRALKNWINIHTVRCGTNGSTEEFWKKIAATGEGKYTSVAQDGGMAVVTTPMDEEMAKLNAKLSGTFLAYGSDAREKSKKMAESEAKLESSMDAELDDDSFSSATADRASYRAKTADKSFYSAGDLVEAYKKDDKVLKNTNKAMLPQEMREMNDEQRKEYMQKKIAEREQIQKQIIELDKKRQQYIRDEMAKAGKGKKNAFDTFVLDTLMEIAKKRGVELSSE